MPLCRHFLVRDLTFFARGQSEQQLIKEYYTTREPEKMHVLSRMYNANVNSCSCMAKNAWEFMKILHWMCDQTVSNLI